MSISFRCSACKTTIRVAERYAGKGGPCPECGARVRVPAPGAAGSTRIGKSTRTKKPAKKPGRAATPSDEPHALEFPSSDGEAVPATSKPPKKKTQRKKSPAESYWDDSPRKTPEELRRSLRKKILNSFDGTITPVRKTIPYRIGVLCAAAFVVVLPVLYVALIGAAGYGVYWHATENSAVASMGTGRGRVLAIMVYVAPVVVGSMVVLFMLKPLMARRVTFGGEVSLNRAGQPLLFEFVEKICDAVNAPRPSQINVVFDINAAAGYSGGVLSVVRSELVLTIGLPLMAGLSLQQFAGVLAHEFGHFSQGAGMRVSWIVRSINNWFAHVVYMRDSWDEFLVEMSEENDIRVGWIFYLARMAVFFSRGLLWCFMMLGHAVTCWLARQMEFDADRYEARLAGSETFEETCFRLHWLGYGLEDYFRNRMVTASTAQETGNPIRDFIRHCDSLSEYDEKRVRRRIKKAKTSLLDTHPADSERIENAMKENASGVFKSNLPAESVVHNFDRLCASLFTLG